MNKVVAFSLWGSHPAYYVGAIENAKLIGKKYYIGWSSWFYVGNDAPKHFVEELSSVADRLIFVNHNKFALAFERFSPIFGDDVEVSVSRDADSRVSDKEYQAVLEWEKTNKPFHAMRDHKLHHFPIMAGMWGVKKGADDFVMQELMREYLDRSDKFKTDQMYLRSFYERYKDLFYEHDEIGRYAGNKFPAHKSFDVGSYIGQRIDQDNCPASDMEGFSGEGY